MKRSEMITKKDFDFVHYRHGGRLQGQENLWLYMIVIRKNGKIFADGFSSKRSAEQWLGPRIKAANMIRAGKIQIDK